MAEKETTSVRITRAAHETLRSLAEADGLSLTDELDRIIEAQRRQRLFDQADAAYRALREDEETWERVSTERDELEGTLADGLDRDD
jgi:hypothetical protein